MRCTKALGNWIALSMSILSQETSQFLPKLAKLIYTVRQVVSWQGRYNDELDGNGIYMRLRAFGARRTGEEREKERERAGETENG